MCFNRHDSRCDLVLHIIIFVIYSNLFFCSNAAQSSRERSSIILYQGTDKYHLDAKDCPVGKKLMSVFLISFQRKIVENE